MKITKKEFKQELENFKKHKEAGTLVYDYKFCRFSEEEISLIKGGADAYVTALDDGRVRIALVDNLGKKDFNIDNLADEEEITILQRSGCC